MSPLLLKALGGVLILIAMISLITGKVMAGSRGLRSNVYTRQDSPVLYYCFICFYLLIGLFVLFH